MKQKQWSSKNHHADSSWRMFKIMAEFADGFDRMEQFGPCISIFGSARTKPDNPYYKLTEKIAEKFTDSINLNLKFKFFRLLCSMGVFVTSRKQRRKKGER